MNLQATICVKIVVGNYQYAQILLAVKSKESYKLDMEFMDQAVQYT